MLAADDTGQAAVIDPQAAATALAAGRHLRHRMKARTPEPALLSPQSWKAGRA